MSKDRGFKKLVGKTIKAVNTKVINEVLLTDEDGTDYVIGTEVGIGGIPIITLKKLKPSRYEVPEKKLKPLERTKNKKLWPFPLEKTHDYD